MDCHYIWMNGQMLSSAEAQVPFLTPALHYGVGVFEGIRCYPTPHGPSALRLREHLQRLIQSAMILGWRTLPYDLDELIEACHETVAANGFDSCYVRPLIYLAGEGWNLSLDSGQAHVGIAVWQWDAYLGADAVERGVRANVSSYTRHHPNVAMSKAKISGNYPNSVLAKTESLRLGFDEAIMLDPAGLVAECTGENIFLVRKKQIVTPPLASVLEGITRDTVIVLARDVGYEVLSRAVSRDELYTADEVFVSGTAAELIALREIDFRRIGTGQVGMVTRRLRELYEAVVRGDHPRSSEWMTPIRNTTRVAVAL